MGRTLVLAALGLVVLIFAGWLVVSLFGAVLKLAFYLLVGAAVVGGGYYLVTKGRAALRSGRYRQLP